MMTHGTEAHIWVGLMLHQNMIDFVLGGEFFFISHGVTQAGLLVEACGVNHNQLRGRRIDFWSAVRLYFTERVCLVPMQRRYQPGNMEMTHSCKAQRHKVAVIMLLQYNVDGFEKIILVHGNSFTRYFHTLTGKSAHFQPRPFNLGAPLE